MLDPKDERRLRAALTAVAVVAFVVAPVALVLIDALGLAREGFTTDISLIGLFIAAVLTLLGLRATDFTKRGGGDR